MWPSSDVLFVDVTRAYQPILIETYRKESVSFQSYLLRVLKIPIGNLLQTHKKRNCKMTNLSVHTGRMIPIES